MRSDSKLTIEAFSKDSKLALVTGANGGLGRATAQQLAKDGYTVIIACRHKVKGLEAAAEIRATSGGFARFVHLDLADLSSVRNCAEGLIHEGRAIDLLVNNAGIMECPPWTTKDGYEMQMGTNHLGHFALTLKLLPLLALAGEDGKAARIVNVASAAHAFCQTLDAQRLGVLDVDTYVPSVSYGASKTANILFTRELARRLRKKGLNITVNALCPGLVSTNLGRHMVDASPWYTKSLMRLLVPLTMSFAQSVEQGASSSLHVATSEELEGMTGTYFVQGRPSAGSKLSQDMTLAKELWIASESLSGLKFDEILPSKQKKEVAGGRRK